MKLHASFLIGAVVLAGCAVEDGGRTLHPTLDDVPEQKGYTFHDGWGNRVSFTSRCEATLYEWRRFEGVDATSAVTDRGHEPAELNRCSVKDAGRVSFVLPTVGDINAPATEPPAVGVALRNYCVAYHPGGDWHECWQVLEPAAPGAFQCPLVHGEPVCPVVAPKDENPFNEIFDSIATDTLIDVCAVVPEACAVQ
jgi:hypothetical protein